MSQAIQTLPADVVHLIAAGEVIDSLAAVVRELVENALDAGATRIAIAIWPEAWRIRVADNGWGMNFADLKQAATAHTTSKIRDRHDLWKITSLGFRGEALHSLAQLSSLEILSRPTDSGEGWRIVYNSQGQPQEVSTVAIAPGTIVTVADLFGAWPVRRQGLPTLAQQLRLIQLTIQQMALCHPSVTWQVEQSDRRWFTIHPGKSALYILPQLLRDVHLSDFQSLTLAVPQEQNSKDTEVLAFSRSQSLELVMGLPDRCHRGRPDWIKVALNGRLVRSPELEQTILSAFVRTLPRDRYPICYVHLTLSPDQIDWNRHPAKAEIYLHNLTHWQDQIHSAIQQALSLKAANLEASQQRITQLLKVAEAKGGYSVHRAIEPDAEDELSRDRQNLKSAQTLPNLSLKAVAQVLNTYIVAEHPGGIWLVEQHIAHERVLYEQLCDRWQLVPLEPPTILSQLSVTQLEQLQRLNLEVEPFGDQRWAVRNAPALLATRPDCSEALVELSLGGDLQTAQVATACRSAIRNGTPLTLSEMQILLDQWQRTRSPRTCPHGRPIYLSMDETDLGRFFRRHWVIGKSHGI